MNRLLAFNNLLKTKRFLWYIVGFILLINTSLYIWTENVVLEDVEGKHSRQDASGLSHHLAHKFVYFYYYTGHFPLATMNESLVFSEAGALHEIEENGDHLINEYFHWSRLGESARIWAYMPNAWLKGSPENPSIKLFNVLVFISALLICFAGFRTIGKPLIGLLLILMINFSPFFVYEIFANQNVFGLMGALFLLVLGLNLPFLYKDDYSLKRKVLIVCVSAVIIALFSEIRNELTAVFLALISMVALFDLSKRKILTNATLVVFACLLFVGVKNGVQAYFNWKFDKAIALVEENGGHPYLGERIPGHKFWHPVFCGLGDYDNKYGYEWNDRVAYHYAVPVLKQQYGIDVAYSGNLHTDNYYDSDKMYYIKFDEIPEYEEVVKQKVLSDISNDPLWYLRIIALRIVAVLTVTLPIHYLGWLIFPLFYYLIRKKYWRPLKLVLVSLPLSITSIAIYSGNGATYNSIYVFMILVVILDLIYQRMERKA